MEKPSKLWLVPFLFLCVGIVFLMSADYYGEIGQAATENAYFWKGTVSFVLGSISIKLLGL